MLHFKYDRAGLVFYLCVDKGISKLTILLPQLLYKKIISVRLPDAKYIEAYCASPVIRSTSYFAQPPFPLKSYKSSLSKVIWINDMSIKMFFESFIEQVFKGKVRKKITLHVCYFLKILVAFCRHAI